MTFGNVNSCIRKSVWEAIPFSDVEFGEDIDWGLRVIRAGHAIVYEPGARVLRFHNESLLGDFKRVYSDDRNLKHLPGMKQIPTLRCVLGCTASGVDTLWRTVPLDNYPPLKRLYWRLYAVPWSLVQNAAQYFGARSNSSRTSAGS